MSAQQGSSLTDVARQARAQKQQSQNQPATNKAQEKVNELEEEQDDAGSAPAGFKTYNAGDYKLRIPAPFNLEGRDDSGTVLSSRLAEGSRSMVMVGNSVLFPGSNSDEAFEDYAARFARMYATSPGCTQTMAGGHTAYQCGLSSANLLGHVVSGTALFVRGSKSIFPVLCVAPTESWARDLYNSSNSTYRQKRWATQIMQKEDQQVRNSWQTCESVLQSIHLKEDDQPQATPAVKQVKAVTSRQP
jgi:hypothetical protein